MDFGELSDNPFSIDLQHGGQRKKKAVQSAATLLVLVAIGLTLTLVVGSQTKRWLVHHYTADFETLSSDEKRARLIRIADLGPLAIEPMVQSLADPDFAVARTAYELLQQAQNDWTVLDRAEIGKRHAIMVDAIESIAIHMPDDRTGWGTSLLQQTIQLSVNRSDPTSTLLYDRALATLDRLALSDRAGPSILSDEPLDPLSPRRLVVRSEPLPVEVNQTIGRWTDWPPPADDQADLVQPPSPTEAGATSDAESVAELPSVYRSSSARLRPVDPGESVILHDIDPPKETGFQAETIQSVVHLVDSPMENFDDRSVMRWLGSPHQELRQRASDELVSRGFGRTELDIATQIVSGDRQTRIDLVEAIAHHDQIDPRPWLMMMLEDQSRDVKLRVISVLATMNDPAIEQTLRMRLSDEADPTVAARIRRVLDLR